VIIAEHLYKTNPDYNEGDLTKTKALLVNESTLSKVGQESGLNEMILLSPEEEKCGGRFRPSIISDAVEAVIGAIYLDGGISQAWEFISHLIIERADEIFADSTQQNYKGELLEYLQRLGQPPPYYEVVSEEGPDHDKTFNVAVRAGSRIDGMGSGPSKKEAEQRAAEQALEKINLKDEENSEGLKED
jgi:ribonuclease-3